MNRATLWSILLIVFSIFGEAKAQCLNHAVLCKDVENVLPLAYADDSISIQFYATSDTLLYTYVGICRDSQIVFIPNFDLRAFGYYEIFSDGKAICYGSYESRFCAEIIKYSGDKNCKILNLYNYSCTTDSIITSPFRDVFCLRDTVMFSLEKSHPSATVHTQPFTPERLAFDGEIVSYTDSTFFVTFSHIDHQCMRLLTTTTKGDSLYSVFPVTILPNEAVDIYNNGVLNKETEICIGDTLHLTHSLSSDIGSWWTLDNNIQIHNNNFDFNFTTDGTFLIKLEFSCGCMAPSFFKVIVNKTAKPKIKCIRTVCVDEEVTYTSENACHNYYWRISEGGVIVNGGKITDNFVTVKWTSPDKNFVSLETPGCLNAICERPSTETINVINAKVNINGKADVCDQDITNYTVPYYSGTTYLWQISGHGTIISGQGSNTISVRWSSKAFTREKISVSFENCNINCKGNAILDVSIKPYLRINNYNIELCQNMPFAFTNSLDMDVKWIVELDSAIVLQHTGKFVEVNFSQPGSYTLYMVDTTTTTCNVNEKMTFKVLPNLRTPTYIYGNTAICTNQISQYQIAGLGGFDIVHWTIYDGDTLAPTFIYEGLEATYNWKSTGPYKVSAYIKNTLTGCVSKPYSIYPKNTNSIIGYSSACRGTTAYYQLNDYNGEKITWSITPTFGYKIVNSAGQWITIQWNQLGTYTIKTKYCGKDIEHQISVIAVPVVNVKFDALVCYKGLSKVEVDLKSNETFSIQKNNVEISNSNPSMLPAGTYTVYVSNGYCSNSRIINIISQPEYIVNLNLIGTNYVCPPIIPQTIFMENASPYLNYQWYLNDKQIGTNSPEILTSATGYFTLKVTDFLGCTASSSTSIEIDTCCEFDIGEFNSLFLKVKKTDVSCKTKNFEIIPPSKGQNFTWYPELNRNSQIKLTGTKISYTYKNAGIYYVSVKSDAPCVTIPPTICSPAVKACEIQFLKVIIPVVANFNFFTGCVNERIDFRNASSSLINNGLLNYSWDFGDPSSGSKNNSTLTNPSHVFQKPGDYIVTLISSEPGGCIDSIKKVITIYGIPDEIISSRNEYCVGEKALFIAVGSTKNGTYFWNFDDPSSGSKNTSFSKKIEHEFKKPGIYNVKLKVSTENGICESTITKSIFVAANYLDGVIICNTPLPKCPTDTVLLTAPYGDYKYLWNTGETTQSISTSKAGSYSVTITHNTTCSYTPPTFYIYNNNMANGTIYAKKYLNFYYSNHFDSINVCVGDSFDIVSTPIPSANYSWSNGYNTNNELKYADFFKALTPGVYELSCKTQISSIGCTIETKPFKIRVMDAPPKPFIEENNNKHCFDSDIKLFIKNPQNFVDYAWNTGHQSDTIKVTGPGTYSIFAYGNNGCKIKSNEIKIDPTPSTNEWLSGCLETCLPRTFCLNLYTNNNYSLYHNGTFLNHISPLNKTLDLNEEGDYQVKITNIYGCESLSDIFSLSAEENYLSIHGKVYYDVNENNSYDDDIDILLNNIPVYVSKDSTVIQSLNTKSDGSYRFDSLHYRNLVVTIDVKNSGYGLKGNIDSTLQYFTCIDGKVIDFPLVKNCISKKSNITAYVCHGESIKIGDNVYQANDKDTLIVPLNENCDSLVHLEIIERKRPEIALNLQRSCQALSTGSLHISNKNGMTLLYAVDDQSWSNDSLLTNISKGPHYLWVQNEYGCKEKFDFVIEEHPLPEVVLSTEKSCSDSQTGSVKINIENGDGLTFKIDSTAVFANTLRFDKLSNGGHTLFVKDTFGCIYEQSFTIGLLPSPEFDYALTNSCREKATGILTINANDNYTFSLDSIDGWKKDTFYDQLNTGLHILYTKNEYGCIDSTRFEILKINDPIINAMTNRTCRNSSAGSITIQTNALDKLKFKLNEEDAFASITKFDSLLHGQYTLIYQDSLGCQYTKQIAIDTFPRPDFHIEVEHACENQANGKLYISAEKGLHIALDNAFFNDSISLFENIAQGIHHLYTLSQEGCKDSTTFEMLTYKKPNITTQIIPACENLSNGYIRINGDALAQYSLDGIHFDTSTVIHFKSNGDYQIYYKTKEGCIYNDSIHIPLISAPVVQINHLGACKGKENGTIQLLGLSDQYTVSLDSIHFTNTHTFEHLPIGAYKLYLKNEIGCVYSLETSIIEYPLPSLTLSSLPSCPNINTGMLKIFTDASNLISINGQPFDSISLFNQLDKGHYVVAVQDTFHCVNSYETDIIALPVLEVDFPPIALDCYTEAVLVEPKIKHSNGIPQFQWSTGETKPSIQLSKSGLYSVTINDQCEQRSNEWNPNIHIADESNVLHTPNIFYPNSATGNECFKAVVNQKVEIAAYHLSIYDRWGNLVYDTHNPNDCWDGRFNGTLMVPGVYVFISDVEVRTCDTIKKVRKIGDVTLAL